MLELSTLQRARDLGALNEEKTLAYFTNDLARLGAQLHVNRAFNQNRNRYYKLPPRHAVHLRAIVSVDARVTDFFVRIAMIERLWAQALSADMGLDFYNFGCLLIRDVHVDILSAMDAVARVAILTGAPILGADHPKIGDLLAGSHNAFRTQLPEVVRELMESSTRWIKLISTIRNLLTHRDHEKLIFGPPTERRQFQVYEGALLPKILEPFLLVDTSSNIVDLDRYLAFVWAEMNVLMDKLGSVVACHLGVQVVLTARRETTSTFLLTDLDAMIGS